MFLPATMTHQNYGGPLYNSAPDSPLNVSSYYVWLSRLSEADWLGYLGRGRCVVEIKMRLIEKSSACLAIMD
jgi:hypothetical protein